MKSRRIKFVLASLVALGIGGCGLRGPLYLPENTPPVASDGARPAASNGSEKVDPTVPLPAPQAQKRDRTTQPAGQTAPQTAN